MASLNNKLMNTFPNSVVFPHDPPGRKSSVYLSMWPWHSYGDGCNRKRVIIKLNLGGMLMTNATRKKMDARSWQGAPDTKVTDMETFVVCYFF